jgi:hypothetical protein
LLHAGLILAISLLPDSQAWPGGSLLAPGGQQLQQGLAQACLSAALALVGLSAAGGFAGSAAGGGSVRQPPQVEDAADGKVERVPVFLGNE